ncbi:MAG: hypothetical protein ACRD4W_06775 [Nitrososphaeraceae archaeon]
MKIFASIKRVIAALTINMAPPSLLYLLNLGPDTAALGRNITINLVCNQGLEYQQNIEATARKCITILPIKRIEESTNLG